MIHMTDSPLTDIAGSLDPACPPTDALIARGFLLDLAARISPESFGRLVGEIFTHFYGCPDPLLAFWAVLRAAEAPAAMCFLLRRATNSQAHVGRHMAADNILGADNDRRQALRSDRVAAAHGDDIKEVEERCSSTGPW